MSASSSRNVVIASIARTPIGKFCGSLSNMKGTELGSHAIKGALSKISYLEKDITIQEAYLGNVVSAGMGQAPARQAVIGSGLSENTICTTINKVCASGMKSVMLGCQSLQLKSILNTDTNTKEASAIVAGGFESMSNIPHYMLQSRNGISLGHGTLIDGIVHDGLWDVYNDQHMGMCAEKCSNDYSISREEQDEYALQSYRRAQEAIKNKVFEEIIPVEIPQKRGKAPLLLDIDEEPNSLNLDKLKSLKPAFDRSGNGTVTAANSSSLNDGACALILMYEQDAIDRGIKPLARIIGYGDAEQNPVDFTTAPALAIPVAIQNSFGSKKLQLSDIDYHEINEAFSVVALANMKILNLDSSKVNVFGGAVSLGHPIGMSGARIIGTLYDVLKHKNATIGCASICNGGGGASAIVIERLN